MFTPDRNNARAGGQERKAKPASPPRPFRPPRDKDFRPSSYRRARRENVKPWFPLCLVVALAGLSAQPSHAESPGSAVVSQQSMLVRHVEAANGANRGKLPTLTASNNLLAHGSRADGRLQLPSSAVPTRPLRLPGWLFILLALGLLTYSRIDGARG